MADVLADGDASPWVSNLASRVIDTRWDNSTASDAMMSHLLILPPHLLCRVISSCIASKGSKTVFAFLPPPLHDTFISCAAADGALVVPEAADIFFYLLLAKATISGAGLLSIKVSQRRMKPAASTAAMLGRALCSHPSLTSLDLSDATAFTRLETFRALTAALHVNALPALSAIKLTLPCNWSVVPVLVEFMKKTASARSISIKLYISASAAAQEHEHSLQTAVGSSASPARVANLQELTIAESLVRNCDSGMARVRASVLGHLLAFLRAPNLTRIELTTDAMYLSRAALLVSLSRFAKLQELHIDAEALEPDTWDLPATVAKVSLPALANLTVESCCGLLPLVTAASVAGAAAATLTNLLIKNSGCSYSDADRCNPGDLRGSNGSIQGALSGLWGAVGQCERLTRLEMRLLPGMHAGAEAVQHSEALAGCLRKLSNLTWLALETSGLPCKCVQLEQAVPACTLNGAVVGPALAALTTLQKLRLLRGDGRLVIEEPDDLLVSCGKLAGLRELGLCAEGPQLSGVAEVVPKLKQLTMLVLLPSMFLHENDMDALKGQFPELTIGSDDN